MFSPKLFYIHKFPIKIKHDTQRKNELGTVHNVKKISNFITKNCLDDDANIPANVSLTKQINK